ncbi:ABC transporter substrate-binding protein [Legionella jordanis]|uniref:ABC transporter substrate-binding protein n=1 Tax=Legionella jordanis TaxID=456 RepID=UPI0007312CC0|nr:ABC transporter substrate-binding protein [Legionella jordanis]RMX05590.1 peptide ABC transporter substrate-binding protein [Legionella jordanis]RMX19263.1 peptide ABC transporter substrate-binding protein [Legionella jordanis]HAT8714040.1 peptide ABC transporter substrate-binding protein [Legionella jordanis]
MAAVRNLGILFSWLLALSVSYAAPWVLNNPYPDDDDSEPIYYSSFAEQPKTLDPAKSYSSNEYQFILQIYEPLLEYDYFIRPYTLVPLIAASMPEVHFLNQAKQEISNPESKDLAFSLYRIHIKPGIYFQPHPAFAKDAKGEYLYLRLTPGFLEEHDINNLSDFPQNGTRQLTVDDYIYQIKRLANPAVNSPIYGLMSERIVGFRDFSHLLITESESFLDLRRFPLAGVTKIDDFTFEILLYGLYPQFSFWLAMPFFAPVPWEVDQFYSQAGMDDKNLSFDWYPVGTGPFMLTENNPNRRMVLDKNPNFRQQFFPMHGSRKDEQAGYLQHAGERLPLISKAIFSLEKESIPRWNKFLQGYYDLSGVSTDSFDQAIQISPSGEPKLTSQMQNRKIRLSKTTDPSIYYMGFNMLDPVIGGRSERARKLRLAISIAVNFDENIAIFYNGRGKPAQGPIPPGIFGYREGKLGINPYVYQWKYGQPKRRPIEDAKRLMREAGYPNGVDKKTGKPLMLHYDVPITGGPDDKALLDWMRKQFAQIGIDLNVRATQYNRFQDKMRSGNAQIFSWGWNADYPDPENFLFMLYGKNGKVKHNGENATNYENRYYDKLFELMRNRQNDSKRQQLIDSMVEIVRHDAPWAWGVNTETLSLSQQWVSPVKPNTISLNALKYLDIDVKTRNQLRATWNKPIFWPLGLFLLLCFLLFLPLLFAYIKKEKQSAPRIKQ